MLLSHFKIYATDVEKKPSRIHRFFFPQYFNHISLLDYNMLFHLVFKQNRYKAVLFTQ